MRVAFVLARFGTAVLGGAETLGNGLAREAARHGWEVEVWTTCATDYISWQNKLPAGVAREDGITIRRFAVDPWDQTRFHSLNLQMHRQVDLPAARQYDWVDSGPHSTALNRHVKNEAGGFDAVVTMPYLGSITFDAAWIAQANTVVWPCLHKEIFAHMEPFRLLLESVHGVVFLSPEEAAFARNDLKLKLARSEVIGSGVSSFFSETAVPQTNSTPYLLYLGRLDHDKNVQLLYDFVIRYVAEGGRLRLLVAGDGLCKPPERPEFQPLGFIPEAAKGDLYANALAVCQPSYKESFSLVIMESWLAGRPALVWSGCDVTRGHVQRGKGGLWFGNYAEFKETVDWLLANREAAGRMGINGREYVRENFTWERVFARFEQALADWRRAG